MGECIELSKLCDLTSIDCQNGDDEAQEHCGESKLIDAYSMIDEVPLSIYITPIV